MTEIEKDTARMALTVPGKRRPSPLCEALVKDAERLRLKAYLPTRHDKWTVGWGETGPHIGPDTVWTEDYANASFSRRLRQFAQEVDHLLGDTPTTQAQFDALVSLAYNIGVKGLSSSTLLFRHKGGLTEAAAYQFRRWNKQAGKVLRGLVVRRWMERELYLTTDGETPSWYSTGEVIRPDYHPRMLP